MALNRPTLAIPVAGDYPLYFQEGYWFRWQASTSTSSESSFIYIRGKVPIQPGQTLTWTGGSKPVVFTVIIVQWNDTGEMMLTVSPNPSTVIGQNI